MDYEIIEKDYKLETNLSKKEIEEKILHNFYFLKQEENLNKFYGEYKEQEKFDKEDDNEEEGDIILENWEKITKFILGDIFHCFYIKISDIRKYATINGKQPIDINKIMQELRMNFIYITISDLYNDNFYKYNFQDLYPQSYAEAILGYISYLNPISAISKAKNIKNMCREEKNDKNENKIEKKNIRKDLSKDEIIPENSILFNYEFFQTHCDCFLMVIKDILEDNDSNVIREVELINNIKENYVENERNRFSGKFKLRFGTKYLNETMFYLEKIKKIKTFYIQSNEKFVKVMKNKDDIENEEDKKEAENILNDNENKY